MRSRLPSTVALWVMLFSPLVRADDAPIEFFESKIRPVLVNECYSCHSAGAAKLKGALYLDSKEGILKGGESEQPGIVPGKPDESQLIQAIRQEEEGLSMPPKKKLSAQQIADFETWVKLGAPMPVSEAKAQATTGPAHPVAMTLEEGRKFWSFVPPREQAVPTTQGSTEIDRFIREKLDEKKIAPSPRADKRTLIRRATFDLTGLPPTAAEVEAFVGDTSADAFAKVVDRLLASPHYGERWGRYWLDVARFADTKGYMGEEDRRYAFSYTYRDWVVRSLNADLPYDQFLIQQIAADRLELGEDKRPLAALGFLTLGRRFIGNVPDIIDDRIDVVTRGTMALTVACARCHDHKYDPIPTADYYSLYGVFASSIEPAEMPLIGGDAPPKLAEFESARRSLDKELDDFVKARHAERVAELRTAPLLSRYLLAAHQGTKPPEQLNFETVDDGKGLVPLVMQRWQEYLKNVPATDPLFAAWKRYSALPGNEFEAKAKDVSKQVAGSATENPLVARFVASPPPKSMKEVAERYAKLLATFDGPAVYPDPAIESIRMALRADSSPTSVPIASIDSLFTVPDNAAKRAIHNRIADLIATHPGSPPRAQGMQDAPTAVAPYVFVRGNPGNRGKEVARQFPAIVSPADRKPFANGSGRLELAKAIASKENPLTARVMVNRVWQYHFGAGLVRTPADFGTRGEPPTHPELLDWLALRFANDDGWSIKKLHRRIMLSDAYQQASLDRADARTVDPDNKLLWRMNPRRLDFEAMRDSLLVASGAIDLTMGGRSVDILSQPFSARRSIYAYIDRQNLPGMFRTFDFASPDQTSSKRFSTSVPQQALFMMNSPFAVEQSKKLAARVTDADPVARVTGLYRVALSRSPTKEEIELAVKFVQAEEQQPAPPMIASAKAWQYGFGEFDETTLRLKSFTALPHFTGAIWRGGEAENDPKTGWASLTATGGHVGNDLAHGVTRRWTASRDCTISIDGKLAHNLKQGDGVRARLVSSREGMLATWMVHNKQADTTLTGVSLKQGDTIDFFVDCGAGRDYSYDSFTWTVTITKQPVAEAVAGDDAGGVWNSQTEFAGPAPKPPDRLNAWEKYAQVLLESNEFVFVD